MSVDYVFHIAVEKWDPQVSRYVEDRESRLPVDDIFTPDGLSFGDLNIRYSKASNYPWAGKQNFIFETRKSSRELIEGGVRPVVLTYWPGQTESSEREFGTDLTPEEKFPFKGEKWEKYNAYQLGIYEEPDNFMVTLDEGGPPNKIEIYTKNPKEQPPRLIINVQSPTLGEGTGSIN